MTWTTGGTYRVIVVSNKKEYTYIVKPDRKKKEHDGFLMVD